MRPLSHAAAVLAALLLSGLASAQVCNFTEPATPSCAAPRVISGIPGQHVVMMDVSTAGGVGSRCNVPTGHEVWFSVTPAVTGAVTVSTCHPATTYDTILEVYGGASCAGLTPLACNDDASGEACDNGCSFRSSQVTFWASAGQEYRFVVGSFNANAAGCSPLCLGVIVTIGEPCGDAPTNLDCTLAREIPADTGTASVVVDVSDALFLAGVEPAPSCGSTFTNSVWFRTVAPDHGLLSFSTCTPGTNYDTVVAAWQGTCGGLAQVACDDDTLTFLCQNSCSDGAPRNEQVFVEVTPGEEVYFQVGAYALSCEDRSCLEAQLSFIPLCDDRPGGPQAELAAPPSFACACHGTPVIGTARDPNGVFAGYRLEYQPVGAAEWTAIASGSGELNNAPAGTWSTLGLAEGWYLLRLTAENSCGVSASDTELLFVDGFFGNLRPDWPLHQGVVAGVVCVEGTATDGQCFDQYTVSQRPVGGGVFVPVDPGSPVYSVPAINETLGTWDTTAVPDGDYELRIAGATDCGNAASQTFVVTVDNTPPLAEIVLPLNCDPVDGPIFVIGTAWDDNLTGWTLQYSGGPTNQWVTIASGTTPFIEGLLATWDTSGLPACSYALRLVVSDAALTGCDRRPRTGTAITTVEVGGCPGDVDGSGAVDLNDLLILLARFGIACS